MKYRNLSGKRILITGASSGIGRELAIKLAEKGCQIGLMARREKELTLLAQEISKLPGDALVLPADVTKRSQVKKGLQRLIDKWGHLDILIANAGIGLLHKAANLNTEKVEATMQLNFYGTWYAIEAALPVMLTQGQGHIVAISSFAAFRGLPKTAPYSASKAAIARFMESMRVELKDQGIDFTTIYPGFVRTPMTAGNRFKMPFILETSDAAAKIIRVIEKQKAEVIIPWQIAIFSYFIRILPNAAFDRAAKYLS
ncbi:MAG: SDR family NAD(P)-dependent oxidoreductase [Deltaproteobacteria bacterium]|nr:SDR family NAD(P)-dependent oxidoreductase [Deltaproteobacteria bacterium]